MESEEAAEKRAEEGEREEKYGYFSIVIHRARISNYNDGWKEWDGRRCGRRRRLSVLGCAKNSQDEEDEIASMARRRGFHVHSPRAEEDRAWRNDLSPSLRARLIRAPTKLFFFQNVDFPTDDTFTSPSISNCRTGISCR